MSGNQSQIAEAIETVQDLANLVANSADVRGAAVEQNGVTGGGGGDNDAIMDESRSSFIIEITEKEVPKSKAAAPQMEDEIENEIMNDIIPEEEVNSSISSINAEEKFKSLYAALMKEECHPKIRKVAPVLRDNRKFKKYYEPKMVSIGPYHHGNSKLKVSEILKLKLAAVFFQEHDLCKDVIYSEIRKLIKDLKMCYEKEAVERFSDDDLAWMFFLDGCALLQFIYSAVNENKKKLRELKIKADQLAFAHQDFFLLENQLPYRVLELLINCLSNKSQKMRKSIEKFIFDSIKAPGEKLEYLENQLQIKENPAHLLDILRTALLQSVDQNQASCSIVQQLIKNLIRDIGDPLGKIKNLIEFLGKPFKNSLHKRKPDWYSFRNIQELRAAGIRLRPSNTNRLADITFDRGILKLPPLIVDDLTAAKFLNLVAYEMCPDFVNDFGVSSYILFLDGLIDQAQDVKELRDKQILCNALGSDEEVATLFNEISTNLIQNQAKYSDVKRDIQRYYDSKLLTWIAQFNHDHFQSPWSMLAFIAAIIALVSSIIQTVYTVLGYY